MKLIALMFTVVLGLYAAGPLFAVAKSTEARLGASQCLRKPAGEMDKCLNSAIQESQAWAKAANQLSGTGN